MFTDTLLVFDHVTHKIKVLSHVRLDGDIEKSYREATSKIDDLVRRLNQPLTCLQSHSPCRHRFTGKYTSNFSKRRIRSRRPQNQAIYQRRRNYPGSAFPAPGPAYHVPLLLKFTGRCVRLIPLLICIIWTSGTSRSSGLLRKSWSGWRTAR